MSTTSIVGCGTIVEELCDNRMVAQILSVLVKMNNYACSSVVDCSLQRSCRSHQEVKLCAIDYSVGARD